MFKRQNCRVSAFAASFVLLVSMLMIQVPSEGAVSEERAGEVWRSVASAAKIPYSKLHVENRREPNAWVKFSSGSKYSIHITKGLLGILESEHELAGIFGHETGHIVLGHYEGSVGTNLAVGILALVLKNNSGTRSLTRLAGTVGLALAGKGMNREQEVEADDYGIRVATVAGYEPSGLLSAMKRMRDAGYSTSPSGFNSHPPTERRIGRIESQTLLVLQKVAEIDARNGKKRDNTTPEQKLEPEKTENPVVAENPSEKKNPEADTNARLEDMYKKYKIEK